MNKRHCIAVAMVALCCLPTGPSWAQGLPDIESLKSQFSKTLQPRGNEAGLIESLNPELLTQAEVCDSLYRPGPGDIFVITISGGIQTTIPVSVSADRKLVIPGVGEVQVGTQTLKEFRSTLTRRCQSVYRDATISVALARIRSFNIYITGQVERPGGRAANGAMRVSDILEKAVDVDELRYRRNIEIRKEGEVQSLADLALFYNAGEDRENPLLGDNMHINVPKQSRTIAIAGAANWPGIYDYVPGDNLADLLHAAGGAQEGVDSNRVLITRFIGNTSRIDTFSVSLRHSAGFPLQVDDRINLLTIPEYHTPYSVSIQGEIRYPGTYPIRKDSTRLSDIIELAGGLTDDAFLAGSHIVRPRAPTSGADLKTDPERLVKLHRTLAIDPETIWPEEISYLKALLSTTGDRVAADFGKALAHPHTDTDIVLKNGDFIVIMHESAEIQIWGAVALPGLVTYHEGWTVDDYIRAAGGFSRIADRRDVRVRRRGTATWAEADNQVIRQGDAILVPEKKYRDKFMLAKDLVSFSASTLGIIALSISIASGLQSLR